MSASPDPDAVRAAQFRQLIDALTGVGQDALPADRALDRFFRSRRFLGGRDRRFIAEAVFGVLRRRRFFAHCLRLDADAPIDASDLAGLHLLTQGWSQRALARFLPAEQAAHLAALLRAVDPGSLPFAIRHSLPEVLAEALVADWGEEAEALARALATSAPLDLRVNTLRTDRDSLRERLVNAGIVLEPTPYSPYGLRREDRAALFTAPGFKEGAFEVQDEGSQLLACLVDVPPRGRVVDFCAGAGGKTLALAMLMRGTGRLYAMDISAKRLAALAPRAARAGVSSIHTVALSGDNDVRVKRLAGKLDRVLVDAPCSGFGTLRRNPDLKWRHAPAAIAELAGKQLRILRSAARLLKPGGRLVYATCSILREENDDIADAFAAAEPQFRPLPCGALLAAQRIPLDTGARLRLSPHLHGTDGFFAAAFERA